jgi:hypothetical protein
MKRFIILVCVFAFVNATTFSQPCLSEGIEFITQAQIDSFQVNYPGCTEIEGDVNIGVTHPGSIDITNLDGLSVLTAIHGSLNIGSCYGWPSGNPYLSSIQGLSNLTYIGGDLNIGQNDTLRNLNGLQNLAAIGGTLYIRDNPALTSLHGLEGLSEVTDILIWFNDSITNLSGLNSISCIEGSLMIEGNDLLEELTGLESLYALGGDLIIGCIYGIQAGHRNLSLISLSGLRNLTSIGGQLYINDNDTLTSLAGLENLVSIGSLRIEGNPVLEDITALENVVSAIGRLEITGNPNLTSLSGIENINAASNPGATIFISHNSSLCQCDVLSVCDYLTFGTGIIGMGDNAPGCNSQEEVIEACTFGVNEPSVISQQSSLNIYPNPFTNETTFSISLDEPSQVNLVLMDRMGRLVATVLDDSLAKGTHSISWNAEGLPSGIYFYHLTAGNQSSTGKLVVVR